MAFNPLAGMTGPQSIPVQPEQSGGDAVALVKQAISTLRQAEEADADPNEQAAIATCIANLKKIAVGRQKEKESALGTSPALKLAARQNGGY